MLGGSRPRRFHTESNWRVKAGGCFFRAPGLPREQLEPSLRENLVPKATDRGRGLCLMPVAPGLRPGSFFLSITTSPPALELPWPTGQLGQALQLQQLEPPQARSTGRPAGGHWHGCLLPPKPEDSDPASIMVGWVRCHRGQSHSGHRVFLGSSLAVESLSASIDQNNPKRQTADPLWGSPKLDLTLSP